MLAPQPVPYSQLTLGVGEVDYTVILKDIHLRTVMKAFKVSTEP